LHPPRESGAESSATSPSGSNRSFQAQAFDSSGTPLFEGSASGITVSENQTTLVAIILQQVHPPPPFENEAPLIDFLVASATSVPAGGFISLVASAHDPNPGDTLSYAWSATAGSFSSPSDASTSWTAPTSTGLQSLTLTVTDSRGLSSSIALSVNVTHSGGEGEAELSITFNSSPRVTSLSASPTQLAVGQTASVSVSASDPDGDSLSYSWSASCEGSWTNASSSAAQFTPSLLPAGSCNNCRLTVYLSDGHGGLNSSTVALCISNAPPPSHSPPVIIRTYRSSDTATPGQEITYEVVASDPEGSALFFSWEANTGSLGRPSRDDFRSRVTWTAPLCVNANTPPSISVTVINAFQLTATRSFAVTGLPTCQPPVGSWASMGSMASPRYRHTAALLPNGKVLVSGGRVPDERWPEEFAYRTAEVYDPARGTWSPTGSMDEERADHTATPLPNGKVLVAGGRSGASFLVEAEVYDQATGTWSPTGSMTQGREAHTATLLPNGKVLVAGGALRSLQTVEVYDQATGTWSPTGPMAQGRGAHTATLLANGKVLVAGRFVDIGEPTEDAEVYDPARGTWSSAGSMASHRQHHTATLLPNGKVLVAGGYIVDGNYEIAAAELYTP
jgi:hypothetical protein